MLSLAVGARSFCSVVTEEACSVGMLQRVAALRSFALKGRYRGGLLCKDVAESWCSEGICSVASLQRRLAL